MQLESLSRLSISLANAGRTQVTALARSMDSQARDSTCMAVTPIVGSSLALASRNRGDLHTLPAESHCVTGSDSAVAIQDSVQYRSLMEVVLLQPWNPLTQSPQAMIPRSCSPSHFATAAHAAIGKVTLEITACRIACLSSVFIGCDNHCFQDYIHVQL